MNKFEKTFLIGVIFAAFGIITFGVAGFNGNEKVASGAFLFAGISATVALVAKGINYLRNRNLYGY